MGFLQDLATKAEAALKGLTEKAAAEGSVTLSYLGQTTSIPKTDLNDGETVESVIRAYGNEIGLNDGVNMSAVGVRKDGNVVSLGSKVEVGTYFLTLAREEKA